MAIKDFAGGAVSTTLAADITSGATSATIAASTGWPSGGASGTFGIAIGNVDPVSGRFTTNVEKIRVSSRTGTTLSSLTRGIDGTSALAHVTGETVRHILLAEDIDEVNAHMFDTARHDHTQYLRSSDHAGINHTSAMLGTDSVGSDEIAASAVGSSELAAGAVIAGKIAVGGISAANQFAAGVVDAAAIGADQVGTSEIAPLAVTAAEIANDTITATQVAANAIGASELADNAVDTNAIVNLAVTTGKIADDAVTDAKIENDFARGVIAQQQLTTSEGAAHSASGATDMLLNNVPVVQNHVYAIHIHSPTNLTPGGSIAEWNINLHVNGALYATLCTVIAETTAATWHPTVEGTVYWTAPATLSTDDFTVEVVEVSGSFTLLLSASATAPRWLTITDLGVI